MIFLLLLFFQPIGIRRKACRIVPYAATVVVPGKQFFTIVFFQPLSMHFYILTPFFHPLIFCVVRNGLGRVLVIVFIIFFISMIFFTPPINLILLVLFLIPSSYTLVLPFFPFHDYQILVKHSHHLLLLHLFLILLPETTQRAPNSYNSFHFCLISFWFWV